jgi:hypothetical protein
MALLVDGDINSIDDLAAFDGGILSVADSAGVNLTQKLSQAQQILETDIGAFLAWYGPADVFSGPSVECVILTPVLRQVHLLKALSVAYREAYLSTPADRFSSGWKEYEKQYQETRQLSLRTGLSLVDRPIRRPNAASSYLQNGVGPTDSTQIQVTWVDQFGQESGPSTPVIVTNPTGFAIIVQPPPAPASMAGWNIYAGTVPAVPTQQNTDLIASGDTWTFPSADLAIGRRIGDGQPADRTLAFSQRLYRG